MSYQIAAAAERACADPATLDALISVRSRIDSLLMDRRLRALPSDRVDEVRRLAGEASARLDGASGEPDASPMGRMISSSIALVQECVRLAPLADKSPAQVVAGLHVVASSWADIDHESRGRPRTADTADDPLHLGDIPDAAAAGRELQSVLHLMRTTALPGIALAATCHAGIALARPFDVGSMSVARAVGRVMLSVRGVDPDGLIPVEAGLETLGRRPYVLALQSLRSGDATPWMELHTQAMHVAVDAAEAILWRQ
jgi:hypothetical protein